MRREFCWKTVTCISRELGGPDPGWCPVLDFDTSGIEPSGSAVRQLV